MLEFRCQRIGKARGDQSPPSRSRSNHVAVENPTEALNTLHGRSARYDATSCLFGDHQGKIMRIGDNEC